MVRTESARTVSTACPYAVYVPASQSTTASPMCTFDRALEAKLGSLSVTSAALGCPVRSAFS